MKFATAFLALSLASSLAHAEDEPSGHWVIDKDATIVALTEAGRMTEQTEAGLEMLRDASLDFLENRMLRFYAAKDVMMLECGWGTDDEGVIVFSECVDATGQPPGRKGPDRATWMEDGALHVQGGDDSVMVFRRQ